ncbi:MAG: hypothetical protein R6T85_10650, partial [Egibacteraceae bacterium]
MTPGVAAPAPVDREALPPVVRGFEEYAARVPGWVAAEVAAASGVAGLGVSDRFVEVVDVFAGVTPRGQTPAGFRPRWWLEADGTARVDLVRDLGWDSGGRLRPTPLL